MRRLSNYFVTIFTLLVMCTIAQAAEQKASGTYVYDSTAKTLEFTFLSSTFVCDGPPVGLVMSVTDVSISASSLNWTELWDGIPDVMTWSRVTGSGDSLIGKWQRSSDGSTKSVEFLDATHFEFIGADSSACPVGTGTHTASGSYTYDSKLSNSNLTFEVTTSDFICSGPTLGTDTLTVSAITETAMTWSWDDGNQMLLTRDSGAVGTILGIWQSEDAGNSYTFTIDETTITVVGQIFNCYEGEPDGAYISTNHQLDSYWVDIMVMDNQGTITGVTVTGPGISEPVNLTPIDSPTRWVTWSYRDPAFIFNSGLPTLPLTYTVTITRNGLATVETLTVTGFLHEFAQPVIPSENEAIETLQTFTWIGLGAGYNYSVQLFTNNDWQPIWEKYSIDGLSVNYDGPALTPGSYYYTLQANGNDGNNSTVLVPFTILLKGDLDSDGDIDLGDVITGLKVVAGNTPGKVSTGGDVDGNKKIGIEEAIYSMRVTGGLIN